MPGQQRCASSAGSAELGPCSASAWVAGGRWSGSARSGRHPPPLRHDQAPLAASAAGGIHPTPRCGTTIRPGPGHRGGGGSARPGTSGRRWRWGRERRKGEPGALRLAAGLMTPGISRMLRQQRSCRQAATAKLQSPLGNSLFRRRRQQRPARTGVFSEPPAELHKSGENLKSFSRYSPRPLQVGTVTR
jgi:hypothetical protein